MAVLENDQILSLIKLRPNREKINAAIAQDTRLRFHTVPVVSGTSLDTSYAFGQGFADFLKWVESFLSKPDKVEIFKKVLRPPHASNELTKDIYKELKLAMEAQDKNISLEYNNPELEETFQMYREDIQDDVQFFRKKVFSATKHSISGFLVVDIDPEGNPYSYVLPADRVIDFQLTDDNYCEYLIFMATVDADAIGRPDLKDDSFIAAVDEQYYWLFSKNRSNITLVSQTPHNITWTPAKPIWEDKLDDRNEILAESPLSALLGALDWYLFFTISKRVIDTYGPWPIISMFVGKCSYQDPTTKNHCNDGHVISRIKDEDRQISCPRCNNTSNLVGAGSVVKVPAPSAQNQFTNFNTEAIKFVTLETDILTYITEQAQQLHDYIFNKAVGKDVESVNDQAVNEKQVDSGYESRHAILANFAENIQVIHRFDLDTKNRILFGDVYIGSDVSYGKKFFLRTVSELNAKYEQAKVSGASSYELKLLRDFIKQTEYRDNKDALNKMDILSEIEPFAEYSLKEIAELQNAGGAFVAKEDLILKVNFNKFILRFERENLPINEFGILAPRKTRIEGISNKLNDYVNEELEKLKNGETDNQESPSGSQNSGNQPSSSSKGSNSGQT